MSTLKSGAKNLILCGTVAIGAVGAASARGNVIISFIGVDSGASSNTTIISGPGAGTYHSPTPGALIWQQTGSPENPVYESTFKTYCIEINAYATYDSVDYAEELNPSSVLGFADANDIAKLWTHYDAGTLTGINATAFQLAIWNILYDTDYTLNSGNLTATASDPSAITVANAMLSWLENNSSETIPATLTLFTDSTYQDQVIGIPGTGDPPIPEPATIGIGLIGASALILRRRNKR